MEAIRDSRKEDAPGPDTVLVVEDHDAFRGIVCAALKAYLPGWRVAEAGCIEEARTAISTMRVSVVASDMSLPDGTAKDLVDGLAARAEKGPRVVVFSNYSSTDLQPLLKQGDVHAFVPKDRGVKALAEAIQNLSTAVL